MALSQANRPISVSCSLGDDVFAIRKLHGSESLSTLFRYEVELFSDDHNIELERVLGEPMTVKARLGGMPERFYSGVVSRVRYVGASGRYAMYIATLSPWLWMLTRSANSRIFQRMSVPDIIKQVFREHEFTDFEEALGGNYEQREYCVQYRESDFNFVSRLMEEVGIYYFFQHTDGRHTLVLADADRYAHEKADGAHQVPFRADGLHPHETSPCFASWVHTQSVQPGKYVLSDYDYQKPNADLQVRSALEQSYAQGGYEIYDYPGNYSEVSAGESYARLRAEAHQARQRMVSGSHTVLSLFPGCLFDLTEHPRRAENREYLLVGQNFQLDGGGLESGNEALPGVSGDALALDSKVVFRPPRTTPKPVVQGPQTATVVGPSGQDIWTDELGRVKLKFHWDRESAGDENSSCWVRVSQNWAGGNWGGMFLPHVGHEVIVEFLEGDPDRPLVTGRVYNANKKPPNPLPATQTQSVIRDHGGNYIRMEGAEGKEQIQLHSPYGNTTLSIGAPNSPPGMSLQTDLNFSVDALQNQYMTIQGDWISDIAQNVETKVGQNELRETLGNLEARIMGNVEEKINGNKINYVIGNFDWKVGSLDTKVDGITTNIHGGLVGDTFFGGKHETFVGGKAIFNKSWLFERSSTKENKENYATKYQYSTGAVDVGSKTEYLVGVGDKGNVDTFLRVKPTEIRVQATTKNYLDLTDGGNTKLNCGTGDLVVKSSKAIKTSAKTTFEISSPTTKVKGKLVAPNIEDAG